MTFNDHCFSSMSVQGVDSLTHYKKTQLFHLLELDYGNN